MRVSNKRRRGPRTSRESAHHARVQRTVRKQIKPTIRSQMMGVGERPGWLVQLLMEQGMSKAQATAEANRRLRGR